MKLLISRAARILVLTCLYILTAGQAFAATVDVCLRVDQFQIPGPVAPATVGPFGNKAPIPMWGFVKTGTGAGCTFAAPAPAATASSLPIPTVTATAGDTLFIHLMNNLLPGAGYTEPVSVIIPGQPSILIPTWTDATTGSRMSPSQRVRSFTAETAQQSSSIYSFGPLKAGTYLIQSGTHPAVQMQMGLYGILKVYQVAPVAPSTNGQAYADASSAFNSETALLFSEIDPVLHDAIAAGQYGPNASPPPGWLTSTVDYHPSYFLVNGKPYTAGSPSTQIGATNRKVLIRFLNAGLQTKVPQLQGQYVSIIAEDGNFLSATGVTGSPPAPASCPAPRQQYSVPLPAAKTIDAILTTPSSPVSIPVYDRRLNLTNNGASPGGMFAVLTATSAGGAPSPPAAPPPCVLVGAAP